jgi:sec-independent protein translocase protein TatB
MFGIDSPELLVIAVVALIVVGPKELPGLLRGWGKWMAQMRGMASEFRGHVDEMVRQADLDDVKKQLEATPGLDLQALDPTREIKSALQEGMAEGEKAMADAKAQIDRAQIDNPLVEPESAPQVAAEPTLETAVAEAAPASLPDSTSVSEPLSAPVFAEAAVPAAPAPSAPSADQKPAKAVAAG